MIITISRQYRAGASTIAAKVSEVLGWTVVDDAFTDAIAERSGLTLEDVRSLEESVPSFMERFAQSSALSFPEFLVSTPSAIEEPEAVKLARVTRHFIEELGRRDRVVMVGRAAAAVLASEREAIHVRLIASHEYRVQIAMAELGVSHRQASLFVDDRDRGRERYHKEMFRRDWNDPVNYHMVLNTEALGIEGATGVIVSHARSLGW